MSDGVGNSPVTVKTNNGNYTILIQAWPMPNSGVAGKTPYIFSSGSVGVGTGLIIDAASIVELNISHFLTSPLLTGHLIVNDNKNLFINMLNSANTVIGIQFVREKSDGIGDSAGNFEDPYQLRHYFIADAIDIIDSSGPNTLLKISLLDMHAINMMATISYSTGAVRKSNKDILKTIFNRAFKYAQFDDRGLIEGGIPDFFCTTENFTVADSIEYILNRILTVDAHGLIFTPYDPIKKKFYAWTASDIQKNQKTGLAPIGYLPNPSNSVKMGNNIYSIRVNNWTSGINMYDTIREYDTSTFNYATNSFTRAKISEDKMVEFLRGEGTKGTAINKGISFIKSKFEKIPRDPALMNTTYLHFSRNWSSSVTDENLWAKLRKLYTEHGAPVIEVDGTSYMSPGTQYTILGGEGKEQVTTAHGLLGSWIITKVDYSIKNSQFRCFYTLNRSERITNISEYLDFTNPI
jgi:hypothetical protein